MGGLARLLGVHPSMITRIVKGETAPAKRIQQLAEIGVPEDLLPIPSRPPGRPRGTKNK
ncbi:helix-turn-helix domain-containing protein [Desulfovibrio ferrophilus]|nr:helix-turn-helix transcriptional regulator [Desulfovibrio ferrophilus]